MSDDQQQPPEESAEPAAAPEAPAEENATPAAEAPQAQPGAPVPGADKKVLAGILGILLGSFGVHKFILGYQQEGIIMAAIGGACFIGNFIPFVGCITVFGSMAVGVIGLIEGIMYLTKSDEEFVNTYVTNKKPWF